jgi:hypothetical protein
LRGWWRYEHQSYGAENKALNLRISELDGEDSLGLLPAGEGMNTNDRVVTRHHENGVEVLESYQRAPSFDKYAYYHDVTVWTSAAVPVLTLERIQGHIVDELVDHEPPLWDWGI